MTMTGIIGDVNDVCESLRSLSAHLPGLFIEEATIFRLILKFYRMTDSHLVAVV